MEIYFLKTYLIECAFQQRFGEIYFNALFVTLNIKDVEFVPP